MSKLVFCNAVFVQKFAWSMSVFLKLLLLIRSYRHHQHFLSNCHILRKLRNFLQNYVRTLIRHFLALFLHSITYSNILTQIHFEKSGNFTLKHEAIWISREISQGKSQVYILFWGGSWRKLSDWKLFSTIVLLPHCFIDNVTVIMIGCSS